MQVTGLDHIVLVVSDVERSLAWYCRELGLSGVRVEEWRQGKVPFPSARVDDSTIIDFIPGHPDRNANLDHLCLVVEPLDFDALAKSSRFDVVSGPYRRFGAQGDATSLYVRDPDGLVVELRYY